MLAASYLPARLLSYCQSSLLILVTNTSATSTYEMRQILRSEQILSLK